MKGFEKSMLPAPAITALHLPPAAHALPLPAAPQAFLGDATWAQLFPTQFAITSAFPCFNIKDLHTVDDGVWERLLPLLRQGGSWDVLVAHYLGVDHAGHAHGVGSEEMAAKLAQMDSHVQQVGGPAGAMGEL